MHHPVDIRVRFADTDAAGIAHYATYLRYFEAGRVEAMRQAELHHQAFVAHGVRLPVFEAQLRYHAMARFDDQLRIDVKLSDIGRASFGLSYEVWRPEDKARVASGHTRLACWNTRAARPVALPRWLGDALQGLSSDRQQEKRLRRGQHATPPERTGHTLAVGVLLSDTDARGCIADARYLELFEQARSEAMRAYGLPYTLIQQRGVGALTIEASIQYRAAAVEDDVVFIRAWVSRRGPLRFAFAYEARREPDQEVTAAAETVHICVDLDGRPLRVPVWLDAVLERLAGPAEVEVEVE